MTDVPLVSVITPTWNRHDVLLDRCIPSVAAQTYPRVEHVVVSDGPDDFLSRQLVMYDGVRYEELAEHDPAARWGHWARLRGIEVATGEFLAYLDDDNAFRPHHLAAVMAALQARPDADFGYGSMVLHAAGSAVIGRQTPFYAQIDTSMLVHRRELLDRGTWEPSLPTIDWDIVSRWMLNGARWVWVDDITADKY